MIYAAARTAQLVTSQVHTRPKRRRFIICEQDVTAVMCRAAGPAHRRVVRVIAAAVPSRADINSH